MSQTQNILKLEPKLICLFWQILRTCCHITTYQHTKAFTGNKSWKKNMVGYIIYTLLPSLQRVNQKKVAHLY